MSKKLTKTSSKRTVKAVKKTSQNPASKSTKVVKTIKPNAKASKTAKPATATPKTPKVSPKFTSPHGRADGNPFRNGSAYGVAYDCLHHAGSEGITRGQLVMEVAKTTGKDEKHAGYDVAVLLSAKENGERHQSCRPGFWVERTNDFLKLHVTGTAPVK